MNDSQEAQTRFELVIRVLQTRALPLGYCALYLVVSFSSLLEGNAPGVQVTSSSV